MLIQIAIGLGLIILSVVIQMVFIEVAVCTLKARFTRPASSRPGFGTFVFVIATVMLWLLVAMSVIIWIWTLVLMSLDVFQAWEESLYFSLVAFTTLGFGDVTLPQNWRLLSGFIAADGFLLFGLNTAFILEAMIRFREHHENEHQ